MPSPTHVLDLGPSGFKKHSKSVGTQHTARSGPEEGQSNHKTVLCPVWCTASLPYYRWTPCQCHFWRPWTFLLGGGGVGGEIAATTRPSEGVVLETWTVLGTSTWSVGWHALLTGTAVKPVWAPRCCAARAVYPPVEWYTWANGMCIWGRGSAHCGALSLSAPHGGFSNGFYWGVRGGGVPCFQSPRQCVQGGTLALRTHCVLLSRPCSP